MPLFIGTLPGPLMVVIDDGAFVINGSCIFAMQKIPGGVLMAKVVVGNKGKIIDPQAESKIRPHHHAVIRESMPGYVMRLRWQWCPATIYWRTPPAYPRWSPYCIRLPHSSRDGYGETSVRNGMAPNPKNSRIANTIHNRCKATCPNRNKASTAAATPLSRAASSNHSQAHPSRIHMALNPCRIGQR